MYRQNPSQKKLNALKIAEGKAWATLVEAAEVSTSREAIEKLGETHAAVKAWNKARAAVEGHFATMSFGGRCVARGW